MSELETILDRDADELDTEVRFCEQDSTTRWGRFKQFLIALLFGKTEFLLLSTREKQTTIRGAGTKSACLRKLVITHQVVESRVEKSRWYLPNEVTRSLRLRGEVYPIGGSRYVITETVIPDASIPLKAGVRKSLEEFRDAVLYRHKRG